MLKEIRELPEHLNGDRPESAALFQLTDVQIAGTTAVPFAANYANMDFN